jgi:hypothetical protein
LSALKNCVDTLAAFFEARPELTETPEAAAAMAAAIELDDPTNSATSKSMMVGRFLDALELLRAMSPDAPEESELDRIRQRREERLGDSDAPRGVAAGRGRRSS